LQIYSSTDATTWNHATAPVDRCAGCIIIPNGAATVKPDGSYAISLYETPGATSGTAYAVTGSATAGFTSAAESPNLWLKQMWTEGNTLYGMTQISPSSIVQSADGVTWTTVAQLPPTLSPSYYFDDGATKYVVDTSGLYSSSTDNVTWSAPAVLDPQARSITKLVRLGDHLIAVGIDGLMMASLDGATWTPIAPELSNDPIADIAITDRGVVLVGDSDLIITAP
jgi:hypothetical protein